MKLLIFCPYYPPHVGGLESHADEFNKYLANEGVDITVFTPRLPPDALEKEVRFDTIKVVRFPAFEIINNYPLPKFWSLKFWRQFFSFFKQDFDIVISRTRFFSTSLLALCYAKLKRKPWVHIEHGSDYVQANNPILKMKARLYDQILGRLVLSSANAVIANSKASAKFVTELSPKTNPTVIYRGVSQKIIRETMPNTKLKDKYPQQIITYVGRLIDGKGVTDLLDAFKSLENTTLTLFIIGDGSQRSLLEKKANSLNISKQVIFLGSKSNKEVISIMKISDIIVNPSYTEGLPTSVIEAALCKKALVATDVGGTNEIISDNVSGFLIPPKNPNIMAQKLKELLGNQELATSFGESAYNSAQTKFDWSKKIKTYQELFQTYVFSR